MNVQVEYDAAPEELATAVRANLPAPAVRWAVAGAWLLLSLLCLAAGGVLFAIAALIACLLQVQNITVVAKKVASRAAQRQAGPTSVALTDQEAVIRTASGELRFPWTSVTRATDTPLAWSILVKRPGGAPVAATILKTAFTDAQAADVTAALTRLTRTKVKVRGSNAPGVVSGAPAR
ncbi:hypothetical protein ACFVVA_32245 [Kitasatospora sp. NPDC058048]|uniref:hypothetical protein n=1 Tax=Kitasatospora sp. NPDC058048 TaxID=3346313 RepID=UPI0036DAA09A